MFQSKYFRRIRPGVVKIVVVTLFAVSNSGFLYGSVKATKLRTSPPGKNQSAKSAKEKPDWNTNRLSSAVLTAAMSDSVRLINKIKAKDVKAQDARSAAVSLRIMFNHFDEIGLNKSNEKRMRERREALIDSKPSDELVNSLSTRLEEVGLLMTPDEIRDRFTKPSSSDRAASIDLINEKGLRSVQEKYLEMLDRFADRLSRDESKSSAQTKLLTVKSHSNIFEDADFCSFIRGVNHGLLAAVAASEWCCLFGVPPCCAAAVGFFAAYVLGDIIYDTVCGEI